MSAMTDHPAHFLVKRIRSFGHALAGWRLALRTEANFQVQAVAAVVAIGASWYFDISPTEWLIVVLTIAGVLAMELVNSAIERLADWVQPAHDTQIKVIKDLAAGAVLLVACAAAIVGLIIFLPKIADALHSAS